MIEPEMAFTDLAGNAAVAEDFLKSVVQMVLDRCADDIAFLDERVQPGLRANLTQVATTPFEQMTYTQAVDLLKKSGQAFEHPLEWGLPLQTDHERYLTETALKKPVILTDYPKDIAAFYMRLNDDGRDSPRHGRAFVPQISEIIPGAASAKSVTMCWWAAHRGPRDEAWGVRVVPRPCPQVPRHAPHSGFGLGFERLVLFCTGMANIRDVIPCPRTPGHAEF